MEEVAPTLVSVGAGAGYPVWIGRGLLRRLGTLLQNLDPPLAPSAWAVVSDVRVHPLHGAELERGLAGWREARERILLAQGERAKTWETAGRALRRLAAAGLGRDAALVCLGGGAVSDVGGFVAATYLRGVSFVNVPSTLLAAVDASIGGKTGVNLPEGKNLAGAFHQPRAVVADLDLLSTLPEREWKNGWAETIKVAIACDSGLFELLEAWGPVRDERLQQVVERACRAKAAVVSTDEREASSRRVLNFGHTVGHAIEAAGRYERWSHGEAVALGIACALDLGVRLGVTSPELAARGRELLRRLDLPLAGSGLDMDALAPFLARDKKKRGDVLTFVLLTTDPGRPILRGLMADDSHLRAAIRSVA